jgi:hypothetical protein
MIFVKFNLHRPQKYMNFLFVYLHPSEEIHNKKTTIH